MYRESSQWGRAGIGRHCMSVLDLALWDLKSKRAGLPLWQFLGGPVVDRVPAYANAAHNLPPELLAEKVEEYVVTGLQGRQDPRLSKRREARRGDEACRAVREAIGPDIRLMVDVNGTWDADTAIHMLREWEPFDLYWLEDRFRATTSLVTSEFADSPSSCASRSPGASSSRPFARCRPFSSTMHWMFSSRPRRSWASVPVAPHSVQHVSLHLAASLSRNPLRRGLPAGQPAARVRRRADRVSA